MLIQLTKYSNKLVSDRSASPGQIAFAAQDDTVVSYGEAELARLAENIVSRLGSVAVVIARPSLAFSDWLIKRSSGDGRAIVPQDTETRTFLHDIPVLSGSLCDSDLTDSIVRLLGQRKGLIVEGMGIIAAGTLTVEQAYINWSSVFHSTFVKYLEDVLLKGFQLPGEQEAFALFRHEWLQPLTTCGLEFRPGPLTGKEEIYDEIARVGRYTVQSGLVDSFFGNISYCDGRLIYISQTASSLDELPGQIDPVTFDDSSTAGLTASSELVAHRRIYETVGCRAILHGHPRFSVVMSMQCEDKNSCPVTDCWRDCSRTRYLGKTPVVSGEIGAGGLASKLQPVMGETGRAIVFGHGVFTIGKTDFGEAFQGILDVEQFCRDEYFRIFDQRHGIRGPGR